MLKAQLLSRMERRQWRRYRPTVKNRFFGRLAYYYGHTDTLRSCLSIVLSFFFLPLSLFFFKNFSTSVFLFFFSLNERHVFQASLHASLVPNRKKRILQINRGVEREKERGDKLIIYSDETDILLRFWSKGRCSRFVSSAKNEETASEIYGRGEKFMAVMDYYRTDIDTQGARSAEWNFEKGSSIATNGYDFHSIWTYTVRSFSNFSLSLSLGT